MYNQISSWHGIAYFFMHEINLQVCTNRFYIILSMWILNKKKKKEKDLQTKLDHRNLTFYIILEFNIKFPFNIQLMYLLILLI